MGRVWIFGSYARGEASSKSDIDFLVDWGDIGGYFLFACFYGDLKEVLAKRIDVLTTGQIDDKFLESISKNEVMIFEQH